MCSLAASTSVSAGGRRRDRRGKNEEGRGGEGRREGQENMLKQENTKN